MLSIPYSASEDGPVGPKDREAEILPNNPKGDMVSYCFIHLTLNTQKTMQIVFESFYHLFYHSKIRSYEIMIPVY